MAAHRLALVIQSPSKDDEFLLLKQSRPPKFHDQEYDSFVDSDIWDLPSAQLNPLPPESDPSLLVEVEPSHAESEDFDLGKFDVHSALNEVMFLYFGCIESLCFGDDEFVRNDFPIRCLDN